jgi:hypothetical protein
MNFISQHVLLVLDQIERKGANTPELFTCISPFLGLDMPVGFRNSECINKPSTQLCMWYLMQHVSILVAHLQAKTQDKKRKNTRHSHFSFNTEISVYISCFTFCCLFGVKQHAERKL